MTTQFTFLLVEDFAHIAFSCAVEPLRIANMVSGQTLYSWSLGSQNAKTATCSNGAVTLTNHGFDGLAKCDLLFVLSGLNAEANTTPDLLACLRRERAKGTKIGGLCSAALILASAGFLTDMKAAIHWDFHDRFMEDFPDVDLVPSVFVADEKIITASGGTATADLMLHMIARDHGEDLSIEVADQMVYNAVRTGTAQQQVSVQSRHGIRNQHLRKAIEIMKDNLETPQSTALIAEELGISTRQLERLFGQLMNCSPKKHFLDLRMQKAQKLLVQTDRSVIEVALACGFENTGHFSRVYRARFGVPPSQQPRKLS